MFCCKVESAVPQPKTSNCNFKSYGSATELEERAHTSPLSLLRAIGGSEFSGKSFPNTLRFKNLFVEFIEANYIPSYILLQGKYTYSNYLKEEMHQAKSMRVLKAKSIILTLHYSPGINMHRVFSI